MLGPGGETREYKQPAQDRQRTCGTRILACLPSTCQAGLQQYDHSAKISLDFLLKLPLSIKKEECRVTECLGGGWGKGAVSAIVVMLVHAAGALAAAYNGCYCRPTSINEYLW